MPRALWLAEAVAAEGVQVVETNGWTTRGKPTFDPRGVVVHHDGYAATVPTLNAVKLMQDGRGEPNPVPGPLCNIWLDDDRNDTGFVGDPVAYIIASGVANHAGKGSWRGLSGNPTVFGVECRHTGKQSESWAPHVYDAYVKVVAALCRGGGLTVDNVCGHREWSPNRKIDPTFDLNRFRSDVAAHLGVASQVPTPRPPSQIPPPTPDIATVIDDQAASLTLTLAALFDERGGAATFPVLAQGSSGTWVRLLQGTLRWLTGEPIVIDGRFGPITRNLVERVQNVGSEPMSGKTTRHTWEIIRYLVAVKVQQR